MAVAALLIGAAAPLKGATGKLAQLPAPGIKATHGLKLTIDSHWVTGSSYRPVQIIASTVPPAPATRDQTIRVRLSPDAWYQRLRVEKTFTLPQGATSATTTILVPQHEEWDQFRVEVSKNGREIEELSDVIDVSDSNANGTSELYPTLLVIDSDAPPLARRTNLLNTHQRMLRFGKQSQPPTQDLPDLRGVLKVYTYSGAFAGVTLTPGDRPNDLELLLMLEEVRGVDVLPPVDLPEQWIGLGGVDQVLISQPELEDLIRNHPLRWQSLRAWIAAGGCLFISEVGARFEHLESLEKQLQLPALPEVKQQNARYRNWNLPDRGPIATDRLTFSAGNVVYDEFDDFEDPSGNRPSQPPEKQGQEAPPLPKFAWRDLGMGLVVAIGPGDEFTAGDTNWGWVNLSVAEGRFLWHQRHGVSTYRENDDYWNFLIPGVGTAPVTPFRVLITLFVVMIGPVNYIALRRRHKLQWMLITIPAGALLVTLGLFSFALLTDGLTTRVRVRSYTELDQREKLAVSWSRQCYYAGLAPSRGLTFPANASVTPIDRMPQNRYGNDSYTMRRQIEWLDDGRQRFAKGYLQSRVAAQFLVIQSGTSEAELLVGERPSGPPSVENRLGTRVRQLLLCDSQGNLFATADLAPEQLATLTPVVADEEVRDDFFEKFVAGQLWDPPGFDRQDYRRNRWGIWGRRYSSYGYYGANGNQVAAANSLRSLLELKLAAAPWRELQPRSYLALVEHSPEVPLGTRTTREPTSFEVIAGRW